MATSVKKNAIAKMILNILNVVLPLITGPYVIRVLDVDLYGEFNVALAFLSWFLPFASFGIYNYGIRLISQNKHDEEKTNKLFTSLFCMGCFSSIAVLIVYFLFVFFRPSNSGTTIYIALSIQIIANIFMVEWMNEAYESYGFILFKTLTVRLINVVSIFIFVRKSDDIVKYALVTSGVILINNLLSYIYIKRRAKFIKISLEDLKQLFKPLCIMLLLTNANMFYTALDKVFLGAFSEDIYVSYYNISQLITSIVVSVISSLIIVTIPRLSRYLGEKRYEDYNNLLYSSSRIFFMIGIPMCVGISALGTSIMFLYSGSEYIGGGLTLSLFAFRYILGMCDTSLANQIIFIHGKEKLLTKLYFICGFINLALNSLLVVFDRVTPELCIITTFMSEIVLIYLMTRCIKKNISEDIKVINKTTLKYLLLSLVFYPIIIVMSRVMGVEYVENVKFIAQIALMVITCVAFYFGALFITKDSAFNQLLNTVLVRVKEKIAK